MNLFDMLKAEKDIPVSDPMARLWGHLYQQKHGISEISGVPPFSFISRGGYLQDYRIYGNTVQNGTPTPENPVEVQGCGERTENLFDISTTDGFVSPYGDWSQSIDKRSITVNCSRISGVARGLRLPLGEIKAGTYNLHIVWDSKPSTINIRQNSDNVIATITSADTTFSLAEDAEIEIYATFGKKIYTFEDIMLTRGSSVPSEYIPYGYVIPVTVGGVNLFDYNWLWTKENVKLNDYFNYITIAMKPNTEYTISNNYRVNKTTSPYETALIVVNSETAINTANGGVDRVRTVTTASDGLLRIAYRTAIINQYYQDVVVNRDTLADGTYYIQINEGSSASPYEPYHEPITTPVFIGSEPLHKIGDYADYVDFKRGVVVRRIKKLVLTGTEDILDAHTDIGLFTISFGGYLKQRYKLMNMCSHYVATPSVNGWTEVKDMTCTLYANYSNTSELLYIRDSSFHSLVNFKAFLSGQYEAGTPVTIWYVLAQPEEEPLENLLPIQTIKGSDVLTVDTTVQPSNIWIKGKIKTID